MVYGTFRYRFNCFLNNLDIDASRVNKDQRPYNTFLNSTLNMDGGTEALGATWNIFTSS